MLDCTQADLSLIMQEFTASGNDLHGQDRHDRQYAHEHRNTWYEAEDLIAAVKEKHPDISKKVIVRAAFYALTDNASVDAYKARDLHAFALSERASVVDEAPVAKRRVKSKRKAATKDATNSGQPRAH